MFTVVLSVEMLLMTAVGIAVRKCRMVPEDFSNHLTRFVMNIALPCLIFHSMTAVEASWEQLKNCAAAFVASLLVCALQFALGQLAYAAMGKNGSARITRYGMLFPHFSFMGIPVMEALFGNEGLLYYSIFLIPVRILYYGATKALLLPSVRPARKADAVRQALTNPCLLAVVAGLVFYVLFGLVWVRNDWLASEGVVFRVLAGLVESVDWVIVKLSGLCTPLGLILCGMTLGGYELRTLRKPRYFLLPLIRCVLLPALFFGFAWLLGRFLDELLCAMVVVFTALPVASLTAAYTIEYDPDPAVRLEAAGAVFYSTLLSIITVPIWYAVLSRAFAGLS